MKNVSDKNLRRGKAGYEAMIIIPEQYTFKGCATIESWANEVSETNWTAIYLSTYVLISDECRNVDGS